MDDDLKMAHGFSTDGSSDSFYEDHVLVDEQGKQFMTENSVGTKYPYMEQAPCTTTVNLQSVSTQLASTLGAQVQEFISRALMQSTTALIGPAPTVFSRAEGTSDGSPLLCTQSLPPVSMWSEAAFNKVEGRRRRKPQMLRTSAGENSDSQADIQVPPNETPQQKSLRARRLNRSRARRAKELTNNQKAMNKLPYVIHVDGTGRAKGIHKHKWRAAVRGQCGRLDPSLDNINHHPKHIVDSIWHALEKEWEFEGFAHRAREMFEKSATKFMRNRKMQLKYKCRRSVDGKKPDDVSSSHWSKIVDIEKRSTEEATCSVSRSITAKGKETLPTAEEENSQAPLQILWSKNGSQNISPNSRSRVDSMLLEEDNVDAEIRSLQRQLLRLQKSRKVGFRVEEDEFVGGSNAMGEHASVNAFTVASAEMKENVLPRYDKDQVLVESSSGMLLKKLEFDVQGKALINGEEQKKSSLHDAFREFDEEEATADMSATQMECGDVVRLFAITNGTEKEIGKGIVMGLAGSKYARKVIPQGWRSVKVTSYTCYGAVATCPLPRGWTEQVKHETVKEASGRTILWPDLLLHSLLRK